MGSVGCALQAVKYVEVGLGQLAKVRIANTWAEKLKIKPCCFKESCTKGVEQPAKDGRPIRAAPQCDAAQVAYAARGNRVRKLKQQEASADKLCQQEISKYAAEERLERKEKRKRDGGVPQECRAHQAGRCIKGDKCYESHLLPDDQIMCCSVLKEGDKWYNAKFTKCCFERAGLECPYSHEWSTEL